MDELLFQPAILTKVFDEVIESRRDLVDGAVQHLMDVIRTLPCAREHLHAVELALSEARANAVIHGNREDPDKRVRISGACANEQVLLLAVTDEGEGFDPALLPDATLAEAIFTDHGRGIYLISRLMDRTEHRLGGRQILMRKRVSS
jgi:serine/threonine-protein kinase RsbW